MASTPDIPPLDGLMGSVLDQPPRDAAASIEAMRPRSSVSEDRETFATQVVRMIHARARARLDEADSRPRPDEPGFDELPRRSIRDARAGKDVTRYADLDEASAGLGLRAAARGRSGGRDAVRPDPAGASAAPDAGVPTGRVKRGVRRLDS